MSKFKKFFKSLLSYVWTPFNRDSLWNICVNEEFCTWNPHKAKVGMTFCHVNDETQQHRVKIGVALRVKKVLDSKHFLVEIPYLAGAAGNGDAHIMPAHVETMESHELKVGDWFEVFGQYCFDPNVTIDGKNYVSAHQINDVAEHVFSEPFIDYGQCDR